MTEFTIQASYDLTGDQPEAVDALSEGVLRGDRYQTLLGVTGSGKTFTMANVIQKVKKPTLVIAHNKTLAAQLCNEFREFLPNNAVEYFVSYYDYYQPEAYVAAQDLYIEKDSSINDEIDRLRHAATTSLFLRRDVVIVASVSCIYGLGSPEDYLEKMVLLQVGQTVERDEMLRKLVDIQYARNDFEPARGKFRVRGDSVEIWPASQDTAIRVQLWGDEVEQIVNFDPVSGEVSTSRSTSPSTRPRTSSPTTRPSSALSSRSAARWRSAAAGSRTTARSSRRTACASARSTTWRCCARWATAAASRTTRASCSASSRAPRPTACSTTSPTTSCASSTSRTCRCRRSAPCPRATSRASSSWSTTGSACRAPWTTGRCASTSSSTRCRSSSS